MCSFHLIEENLDVTTHPGIRKTTSYEIDSAQRDGDLIEPLLGI